MRGDQPSVGKTPVQVVLEVIRKQTEEAMRSKTVSSVPPWALASVPALSSCPNVPSWQTVRL